MCVYIYVCVYVYISKVTEALTLQFQKLLQIREFCPEFYDRLRDFCVLSGARFGINHMRLSTQNKNASRTYPRINQLCIDMRKELLSRHHQIIQKRQLVCATELQEGFSRSENDKHEALADGHDEVQFKVLKEFKMGKKEARLIVLDRMMRTLTNYVPEGEWGERRGKRRSGMGQQKKAFEISKIDKIEPFLSEGPTNLCVVISWKVENQRP